MTDELLAPLARMTSEVAEIRWAADRPAALVSIAGSHLLGRDDVALVEVFTAAEQRSRSSQGYVRSAVGERLRVVSVEETEEHSAQRLTVVQRDETSGIETTTNLVRPFATEAVRIETTVTNHGSGVVTLTTVASASVGIGNDEDIAGTMLGSASSEWLAENRWHQVRLDDALPDLNLPLHGQEARGHYGMSSHGGWSSGEHLPVGYLEQHASGEAVAWQIETSAGWHVDLSRTRRGATLGLFGPTDREHHFAQRLAPGESFDTVPVVLAGSRRGRDGAIAELTGYRRWLLDRPVGDLPVVYNDFMNTLMGQPSTEALLPLIHGAADAGAEIFCIDAGWFADPAIGDWWDTVGEWVEAPARFTGGLRGVLDEIERRGMRAGIWLEPEVVGVKSTAAHDLPEAAFFQRFGQRVREHDRYHLDFRHPAARAHLDEVVDRLVQDYRVSYLKLDYNINPGPGTDLDSTSAGSGLLGHTRAFRQWLVDIQRRHPRLLIENCSSGAMRADYALLSVTHLQSTSDQQDFLLYPPIAATAPLSILPEQCGNWAYPAADMSAEETAFTLVTGLSGRLYLSGFLDTLRPDQQRLVGTAVALHKDQRQALGRAVPFWPLGLPRWDDDVVCLGLRAEDSTATLFLWDRGTEPAQIFLPGITGHTRQEFPADADTWTYDPRHDGLAIETTTGPTARVLVVEPAPHPTTLPTERNRG